MDTPVCNTAQRRAQEILPAGLQISSGPVLIGNYTFKRMNSCSHGNIHQNAKMLSTWPRTFVCHRKEKP